MRFLVLRNIYLLVKAVTVSAALHTCRQMYIIFCQVRRRVGLWGQWKKWSCCVPITNTGVLNACITK